jgi:ectoine hydroxylase-related dioxygenase (phytanoyl-CoA dioxygenase family)
MSFANKILSSADIEAFKRDGVICVRQLYSPEWVAKIAAFLDDIVSKPSPVTGPRKPGAKFHSDVYSWLHNDNVRDFVLNAPSAAIAQQVFGSERVTFFYDQIFVKEQLSPEPTPWHHDFTFWPIAGNQIASLWTSVDPVTAETSALEFVAGSHLWPQRYRAIGADGSDFSTGEGLAELPDFETDRSKYNIVSWDLQPGDALLFHALTVHGARGNRAANRKRRAITTRWCGDDITYKSGKVVDLYAHGLQDGDAFSAPVFPQILPAILPEQMAQRMAGPILPDPAKMAVLGGRLAKLDRVEVKPDPAVQAA